MAHGRTSVVGLLLGATLWTSCSDEGLERVPFDERGGRHTFANGMTLDVPAGALTARMELGLRELSQEEWRILLQARAVVRERVILAFAAEPDGVRFDRPVEVVVPEASIGAGVVPLVFELSPGPREARVADLSYRSFSAEASLALSLSHFSIYEAEIEDALRRSECEGAPDASCRCGDIEVSQSDYDASCSRSDCQVVYSENRVRFLDCPGAVEESSILERASATCAPSLELTPAQRYLDLGEVTTVEAQLALGCATRYPDREVTFFATGAGSIRPDVDRTDTEGRALTNLEVGEEEGSVVLAAETTFEYYQERINVDGVDLTEVRASQSLVDSATVQVLAKPVLRVSARDAVIYVHEQTLVHASLTRAGLPLIGQRIDFATVGAASVSPSFGTTDGQGRAVTTLSAQDAEGLIVARAEAAVRLTLPDGQPATLPVSGAVEVLVLPADECPAAPEAFKTASAVHAELLQAVPFDTLWDLALLHQDRVPPRMESSLIPLAFEYSEGREAVVRGQLELDVPAAPAPLDCAGVAEVQAVFGTEAVPAAIFRYYYSWVLSGWRKARQGPACQDYALPGLEALFCRAPAWAIQLAGQLHSSWRVGARRSFSHCAPGYSSPLGCCLPSACPFTDLEGCDGAGAHQLSGWLGLAFDPETEVLQPSALLIDAEVSPELGSEGTQRLRRCEFVPQRDLPSCMEACAGAGPDSCCVDQCLEIAAIDQLEQRSCSVQSSVLEDWQFTLTNGHHSVDYGRTELFLTCRRGCECALSDDCDDGRECTRDACVRGECSSTPDDALVPAPVAGDCRVCDAGEVRSVRETHERECEEVRLDALGRCPAAGEDWRVHWVSEGAGASSQWHYCLAGESPASAEDAICLGAGDCASGAPFTSLQGARSVSCRASDGQELEFSCEVSCTVCD